MPVRPKRRGAHEEQRLLGDPLALVVVDPLEDLPHG
jgi:hypothetical protein